MSTTTNLSTLKINYLTQAQYDTAAQGGDINQNELYFTQDTGDGSAYKVVFTYSNSTWSCSHTFSEIATLIDGDSGVLFFGPTAGGGDLQQYILSSRNNLSMTFINYKPDVEYGYADEIYEIQLSSSGTITRSSYNTVGTASAPLYCECTTVSSSLDKVLTVPAWTNNITPPQYSQPNVIIAVKFVNAGTSSSGQLRLTDIVYDDNTFIPVFYNGEITSSSNWLRWGAGEIFLFIRGYGSALYTNAWHFLASSNSNNLKFRIGTNGTDVLTYPNAELREYGTVGTNLSMSAIYNASASSSKVYQIIDGDGTFLPDCIPHVDNVNTSYSLAASSYTTGTVSAAKSGYVPVGILGYTATGTGSTVCVFYYYYISSGTIYWGARNVSTGTAATPTINFKVLYFPNTWFGTTVPDTA